MLLDLLSESNKVSFNIKVAEIFGLEAAVYLSELLSINEKAYRHTNNGEACLIDGKYFKLTNRDDLKRRTTLTPNAQKKIDTKLIEQGILEAYKNTEDTFYLNVEHLATLVGGNLPEIDLKKIQKLNKKKSTEEEKLAKVEGRRLRAQKAVKTTIPELRTAWYSWIESVLDRYNGNISPATVTVNEKLVDDFANHNLDMALAVVNWTAMKGYNDMQYGIDDYKTKHPKSAYITSMPQIDLEAFKNGEVF